MSGRTSARERFLAHIDKNGPVPAHRPELGPCWIWTAYIRPNGYGRFMVAAGQAEYAHRFSYEMHIGTIPAGKKLDHLCRNRGCPNPHHVEPVTQLVNLMRSPLTTAGGFRIEQCKRGHSEWSTRPNGTRVCRTCKNLSNRAARIAAGAKGREYQRRKAAEWRARQKLCIGG